MSLKNGEGISSGASGTEIGQVRSRKLVETAQHAFLESVERSVSLAENVVGRLRQREELLLPLVIIGERALLAELRQNALDKCGDVLRTNLSQAGWRNREQVAGDMEEPLAEAAVKHLVVQVEDVQKNALSLIQSCQPVGRVSRGDALLNKSDDKAGTIPSP